MKPNKKTAITISSIIAALAAIFFLVPLKAYKEYKEKTIAYPIIYTTYHVRQTYLIFCFSWWKNSFKNFFTTKQAIEYQTQTMQCPNSQQVFPKGQVNGLSRLPQEEEQKMLEETVQELLKRHEEKNNQNT